MILKNYIGTIAGFEPMCPDVQASIMNKLIKTTLLLPAWGAYLLHTITRTVVLAYIMVVYYLMFIINFIYTIFAAIRNFFLDYLIMPIFNLIMWINSLFHSI